MASEYGVDINITANVAKANAEIRQFLQGLKEFRKLSGTAVGGSSSKASKVLSQQQNLDYKKTLNEQSLAYKQALSAQTIATKQALNDQNLATKTALMDRTVEAKKAIINENLEAKKALFDHKEAARDAAVSVNDLAYAYNILLTNLARASEIFFKLPSAGLDAFKSWQDAMAGVERTFSDTGDLFNLTDVQKQLQEITSTLSSGVEDVTRIAALGGQFGIAPDPENIKNFTLAVAQVLTVGGESFKALQTIRGETAE
jgi:hypothetical protein